MADGLIALGVVLLIMFVGMAPAFLAVYFTSRGR